MSSRVGMIHPTQPRIGVGTSQNNVDSVLSQVIRQRRRRRPQRGGGIIKRRRRTVYKKPRAKTYRHSTRRRR